MTHDSRFQTRVLSEICNIFAGFAWPSSKFNIAGDGLPIVRIQNVGQRNQSDMVYWEHEYDRRFELTAGDLLLSLSGSFRIARWDGPTALLNQRVVKLTPTRELEERWLFYAISHQLDQIERMGKHALVNNVSIEDIRNLIIPLPPLAEQRRIAVILDQADAVRRKRQQALALTDQFLRATFLDMFGDPVTNPKRWPIKSMIEIVDANRPITYGILKPGPDIPNGVPYIRVVDIQDGSVLANQVRKTTAEISNQYRRSTVRSGDLLMSIRGHVGRMGFVPAKLEGANITQDTARLAIADAAMSAFVYSCLDSEPLKNWMFKHTKGVAVQGINLGDVKRIPIPIPPHSAIEHFYSLQRAERSLRAKNVRQAQLCQTIFDILVQRAFRGEL